MPRFAIEQRAPGDPVHGPLDWTLIAHVDAPTASQALHALCLDQQWLSHSINGDQLFVQGVGYFRATLPVDDPLLGAFVIQRQDPIGPNDRHLTWTDIATVHAVSVEAAFARYLDSLGGMEMTYRGATSANMTGIGTVRAVPAEMADDVRITPAPRLDEPLG